MLHQSINNLLVKLKISSEEDIHNSCSRSACARGSSKRTRTIEDFAMGYTAIGIIVTFPIFECRKDKVPRDRR